MRSNLSNIDNLIHFRNSQGNEARGNLIHLSRKEVVFEVYNPYSIVQLSEVLRDVHILRGERTIYDGKATVTNLMATGIASIVSATLTDPWSELADLVPGQGLREEVERVVREYETDGIIRPSYQAAVSGFRSFLGKISRLLEQVDIAARVDSSEMPLDAEWELFNEIKEPIFPKIEELLGVFESEAKQISPEEVPRHKAFAHCEIHPLVLCSPYVYRTYTKPLGYAGDYEMVNMMLRDTLEGPNTYAKLVNLLFQEQAPAKAHRSRIQILLDLIRSEAARSVERKRPLRILNIGCGPAAEVQRFIRLDDLSEQCEFHLLDFNEETICYARRKIREAKRASGRKPRFEFIHKSIHELLKEVARHGKTASIPSYDMIYCAGLFDYLSDRVCKRLLQVFYDWTFPGGLLAVTNVHPSNPIRYFMEHLLEWHLIYRNQSDMASLAHGLAIPRIYLDMTGVNVFMEIRKRSPENGI